MTDSAGTEAFTDVPEVRPSFERYTVEEPVFLGVVDETVRILEDAAIDHLFVGGVASAVLGRPRWSDDIDVLVRPEQARRCLAALSEAGFDTQETDPAWLYKAMKHRVLVDVIFKSTGDIYLEDEMVERAEIREFRGRKLRIASPEDLLVMKALAHSEPTPRYWHDALSILSHSEIDWEYLLRRARHGARRVLSLLVYAQSNDLMVPDEVIRTLFRRIYTPDEGGGERGGGRG